MSRPKLYGAPLINAEIVAVAAIAGVDLETAPFIGGVTNKTPSWLAAHPFGNSTVSSSPTWYMRDEHSILSCAEACKSFAMK